jgi:Tfp pilus assembly protein PilO
VKVTQRDAVLLAVLGVLALAGAVWFFLVRPASADLSSARDELTAVQDETIGLRDTLGRLSGQDITRALDATERLETAKALPPETAAPGTIVELERLAARANAQLDSVRTLSSSAYGSLVGTEYEVVVTGAFFDVDDFLYRMHRLVEVNERRTPSIRGRLYATRSVLLEPEEAEAAAQQPMDEGRVRATATVLVFSSSGAFEGDGASGATTTPVAEGTEDAAADPGEGTDATGTSNTSGTTEAPAEGTLTP